MNNNTLDLTMHRRSFVAGLSLVGSLIPALALAEGGLKGTATEEADEQEGDAPGIDEDLQAIGITGEDRYESPQFGYEVEWSARWTVSASDPGETSKADGWDILRLEWAKTKSLGKTLFSFNGFSAPPQNLVAWLEGMTSPTTLSGYFGGGTREVEVLIVNEDEEIMEVVWWLGPSEGDDDEAYMISSYRRLEDDLMLMSSLAIFDLAQLETVVADAFDGLEVNGEPLLVLLTPTDIEDAFAEMR